MKKTITNFITLIALSFAFTNTEAQTIVTDFESFTLTPSSFYKDTNSVPFQSSGALFRHEWTNGSSPYWSGGFSYTNIHDSINGGFANVYNCHPKFGYNNTNNYVTGQDKGIIVVKAPYDNLDGFYITNSTYAYKSMKSGDAFAKKFGGTSGNDPDWFKVTVKGYLNGSMKTDSAVFYLADFRFTNNNLDYIVGDWQWFNTSNLGQVDSVKFFMYSSDVGSFGINTPLFFSIDNVTTSDNVLGISKYNLESDLNAYPNPFENKLVIKLTTEKECSLTITDISGKQVYSQSLSKQEEIDLSFLQKGIYFAEVKSESFKTVKKIIKN